MKLIDLYVSEVGRRLPSKNKADIENELRSILLDMLEDKAKAENREPDDAMVKALLKEYGSPEKVAAGYRPEGYLIGPRFYSTFVMVLKIVVGVVVTLSIIGMGVKLGQNTNSSLLAGRAILESLGGIFQGAFQAFAMVVFIFAVLERFMPADEPSPEVWDPNDLDSLTPPDHMNIVETIFSIVFTVIFMVVLNFYPNLIGIYFTQGDGWVSFPILSDVFYRYILIFDVLWLLQIVLDVLVLREGVWTKTTRIFEIALNACDLVMLIVLILGPSIIQLPIEGIMSTGIAMTEARAVELQAMFLDGFRIVLGLVAGIVLATTAKKVYDLVK